jgi:hypothetical protein
MQKWEGLEQSVREQYEVASAKLQAGLWTLGIALN